MRACVHACAIDLRGCSILLSYAQSSHEAKRCARLGQSAVHCRRDVASLASSSQWTHLCGAGVIMGRGLLRAAGTGKRAAPAARCRLSSACTTRMVMLVRSRISSLCTSLLHAMKHCTAKHVAKLSMHHVCRMARKQAAAHQQAPPTVAPLRMCAPRAVNNAAFTLTQIPMPVPSLASSLPTFNARLPGQHGTALVSNAMRAQHSAQP